MQTEITTRSSFLVLEREANAKAIVVETLHQLGLHSGEVSYAEAKRTFGKWFVKAVDDRRLLPVRRGTGRNGTIVFSITDILNLQAADYRAAQIL